MKTKKFMMVMLTVLCVISMTTVFSACGDDDDIDTPVYTMYSYSNHKQGILIYGQMLDYHLAMYQAKKLAQKESEIEPQEKLAYQIDYNINLMERQVESTGGTPVNVSERDKQVIEWFDGIFEGLKGEGYKDVLTGKFEIYRSSNGSEMKTIKVYTFPL